MAADVVSGESISCQRRSVWEVWVGALVLVVLGITAYSNTFDVPFQFDDFASIPENVTIRKLWPLSQVVLPWTQNATVAGRPVINLSLALNYAIDELHVRGYHVFNLATHLLAGLTLFGLIRRTLMLPRVASHLHSRATGLALTCALLWTLHPLQTESVTYLIQRAESLAGLFYLLTLYCVVRSAGTNESRSEREGNHWSAAWSVVAVICFLIGVGCKEVLVTAPVVVLLYDRYFLSGSFIAALTRRRWLYCGFVVVWVVQGILVASAGNRGSTAGFGAGVTSGQYLVTQFGAVLHYLRLSIWPHPLVFDYGKYLPLPVSTILIQALVFAGLVLILILISRRQPWVGFVALAAGLILSPSSSVIPIVTQVMTEHRMYLPLAAVIIVVVFGVDSLWERLSHRGKSEGSLHDLPEAGVRKFARPVLVGILVLLCVYATHSRNHDYRSVISIWEDTVAKVPMNARAHNNYGSGLHQSGRKEEALREFEAAIALRQQECDPYCGRSIIAEENGDLRKAVEDMKEAVHYCPKNEKHVLRQAMLFLKVGDYEQAASGFTRALQLAPGSTLYHFERGNCYVELGKYKDAIRDFTQVVTEEPDVYRAWHNRGNVYAKLGQLEESIRDLSQAIALRPDLPEPYANRAASYYENRQYDLAWADVKQCQLHGGTVDPELLRLLEERSPRPNVPK